VKNDALLTPQDLYVVAPHSAVINLGTVSGNSSGNPRLDYIVLQVRNQDHDGSGQYDARVRYLTGTANASASHSNPAGAPTIPDTAVLLAQVLVPTGTTSAITNSMIRDRRPWARGIKHSITRTSNASGTNDYTPTSTLANMDATNVYPRLECSGAPLRMTIMGNLASGSGGLTHTPWVDGAALYSGLSVYGSGTSIVAPAVQYEWTPAAGSHQIGVGYSSSSGGSINARSTMPLVILYEELPPASGANG
jgi:hypothetical protein